MKKTFCAICILFLFCVASSGQAKWGVNAGMGLSKISGFKGQGVKTGVLITLEGSVFASLPMGKKQQFVFMPSLGYVPKGIKFNVNLVDATGNTFENAAIKKRIDYLQLSLPFCLKMDWGKNTQGFIGIGPYMAHGLSLRNKYVTSGSTTTEVLDFKKSSINRFDAGLNVHFSIAFLKHWNAGMSTDIGVAKVYSSGTVSTHNQATHVFAGYVF